MRDWHYLKTFCLVLTALLLLSLPLRAGFIEQRDGRTIIHVKAAYLPDPNNPDTSQRAQVEAVKAFVKDFPKIFAQKYRSIYKSDPQKYGDYDWDKVEIQLDKFSSIVVEGVETDLLAIAGGMAPDILYINFRKSDNYIRNGFLYPLDEYYRTLSKEEINSRINSKIWPVIDRKGPDGKKHIWALPFNGALGKVLVFRKDLFDEHGIPYPDENWTWDDFYNTCKKITDPAKGIYGVSMRRGKDESWNWCTFLWSAGGEVMEYDPAADRWKCTFDSDAAVKALDFYTRLSAEKWIDKTGRLRRGYAYKDARDSGAKWMRGEIAMSFDYVDEKTLSIINPETTGMAPVPKGPGGHRGAELNSRMFGLFADIKQPAVRDAAWEYMLYWDSRKAMEIKTRVMVEGGYGRFVNPKYLQMFGYNDIIRLAPKRWARTFEVAIETGKPEPYGKNSNFAYEQMSIPLQEAEQRELSDELPEVGSPERTAELKEILNDACAEANEIMIGNVSIKDRFNRRVLACVVLAAIALAFGFVFKKIFKVFSPGDESAEKGGWQLRRYRWADILLVPAALTIVLWHYLPLARGAYMAFFDYKLLGDSICVGVDNFGDMLVDGRWWMSLYNALRYSFLILAMTFLPPVILAVLLDEVPRGKMLFRIVFYLPAVITGLVSMVLWKQFYEDSEAGMLNRIVLSIPAWGFILAGLVVLLICLAFANRFRFYGMWLPMLLFIAAGILLFVTFAGMAEPVMIHGGETWLASIKQCWPRLFQYTPEPYRWLSDPNTAMVSCILPMLWAGMGPGCLIYLAAMKGIPDDYFEAADIDGATFIDKLIFIVFPMLKVLIIINFVGAFIGSWYSSADNILAMTGGGANTETAALHIWFTAFTYLKFGPAAAMAWMLGFILIGFTVHQLRILSKVEFKTTGKQ